MSARQVQNAPDDQALKVLTGQLVKAVGGVEAADGYCRPNFRRLSEYGRVDNDCFMPIDTIDDLEAVTHGTVGWPLVTRELARRRGFALVALPAAGPVPAARIHDVIARHCKEASEATSRVCAALGDGEISTAEAAEAVAEFDQAIEAAVAARALLQSYLGDE